MNNVKSVDAHCLGTLGVVVARRDGRSYHITGNRVANLRREAAGTAR